jgi:hypothetical protein
MGFHASQKITCAICKLPIDLEQDRSTDENGKAVHATCYIRRLLSAGTDPPDPHHAE